MSGNTYTKSFRVVESTVSEASNELRVKFASYKVLWTEWSFSDNCTLSDIEIYTLNVQISNKFKIDSDGLIMFYNKHSALKRLSQKLSREIGAYKNWVISQFFDCLICLAIKHGFKTFLSSEIKLLNISVDLRRILNEFGRTTTRSLFCQLFVQEICGDDDLFKNACLFVKTFYQEEELRNKSSRFATK